MLNIFFSDSATEYYHTVKGVCGFLMAMTFPLLDMFSQFIQITGGFGGLLLLFFTIRHKIIQTKIDRNKLKKQEEENGDDK